eukprot:15367206-Ditylum_brightwellii.AAC.2
MMTISLKIQDTYEVNNITGVSEEIVSKEHERKEDITYEKEKDDNSDHNNVKLENKEDDTDTSKSSCSLSTINVDYRDIGSSVKKGSWLLTSSYRVCKVQSTNKGLLGILGWQDSSSNGKGKSLGCGVTPQ